MRIQLLGPVRAWYADDEIELGGPRQRALFGLLALAGGQPLGRAELIHVLWYDRPPASAANVIQTHVKHLRRLLDPHRRPHSPSPVLPSIGDGYALHIGGDAVDVTRFRQLVAAARGHASTPARPAVTLLAEALSLWQGTPLADVPALATHPWVAGLHNERQAAVAHYGELMIAAGNAVEALPAIEEAAARQPLDEAVQALLVRAYQAAGRPARAFETYHQTRLRLAEELGVDPGPHLVAAHHSLLQSSPSPDPKPAPAGSPPPAPTSAPATPSTMESAGPTPRQLPADVYGFTGRSRELSQLDTLLASSEDGSSSALIAAVSGSPGVGKTALAVHWAHRVSHRFPDGQLYVDLRGYEAGSPMSTGDALARLLAAVGVPGSAIPPDLDERAARWRTAAAGRRLLVMLDDVASVDQVRLLLPGTPSCMVLVTSRDTLGGLVALQGARRLPVDLLSLDESVTLLRTLIGSRVTEEPDAAEALADRCARLPLALRVAAELVDSRPGTPIADLVAELADHHRRLELLDLGDGDNVRVVFSWSYRRLPPGSAQAFRWLGLHPGPDVDVHELAALGDGDAAAARRWVAPLIRAYLVNRVGDDRFSMHELLRVYAAELSRSQDDEAASVEALRRLFDRTVDRCTAAMRLLHPASAAGARDDRRPELVTVADALAWLDNRRPVLLALCALGYRVEFARQVITIAATLWRYLEAGHYIDALAIHTHALRAATTLGDEAAEADALTSLGAVSRLLGRYDAAADYLHRALDLYAHTDLPQGEARALSNLGVVDERLGKQSSAIAHHRRAVARYRAAGDRQGQASSLNNLGAAYTPGALDEATDCYREALALYRSLGDRGGEAVALCNWGAMQSSVGHFDQALRHLELALELFRALGHRSGEAAVRNNLGDVDTALGRYESGCVQQTEALRIFRELGQPYGEAAALNGLGEATLGCGRPADALAHHRLALQISTRTGDSDEQARARDGARQAGRDLDEHGASAGTIRSGVTTQR